MSRARKGAAAVLREILGGRAVKELSAAELEAAMPKLQAALADLTRQVSAAENSIADEALDDDADVAIEAVLRLQGERRVIEVHLGAVQRALEAARKREREETIVAARATLQADLAPADALADELDALASALVDKLSLYRATVDAAMQKARQALSGKVGRGFRPTSTAMAPFQPSMLQHAIEMHFQSRRGAPTWMAEHAPLYPVCFAQLQKNATAQLLSEFDDAFRLDLAEKESE